jgi:uncharacterized membrane protein
MFGIRGLDSLGLVHAAFGVSALLLGIGVLALQKGTRLHRQIGHLYAANMLLLNGTALLIYDLYGRFGPFHIAALGSLATLGAGLLPVLLRRPGNWMERHADFMCWSYVGLVAAFIAEIAVRIPRMRFGPAAFGATIVGIALGARVIQTRVPQIVARLRNGRSDAVDVRP